MGYLTSKVIPDPLVATSPYPPFNRVLALAQRLGIHPLIETIKTLKVAEITKARKEEEAQPNKRP